MRDTALPCSPNSSAPAARSWLRQCHIPPELLRNTNATRATIVAPITVAAHCATQLLRLNVDEEHQPIELINPAPDELPQFHGDPNGYTLRVLRRPTAVGPTHLAAAGE